jgi:hypothetical protein
MYQRNPDIRRATITIAKPATIQLALDDFARDGLWSFSRAVGESLSVLNDGEMYGFFLLIFGDRRLQTIFTHNHKSESCEHEKLICSAFVTNDGSCSPRSLEHAEEKANLEFLCGYFSGRELFLGERGFFENGFWKMAYPIFARGVRSRGVKLSRAVSGRAMGLTPEGTLLFPAINRQVKDLAAKLRQM